MVLMMNVSLWIFHEFCESGSPPRLYHLLALASLIALSPLSLAESGKAAGTSREAEGKSQTPAPTATTWGRDAKAKEEWGEQQKTLVG